MVEVSNTYRTVATAFFTLLVGLLYVSASAWIGIDGMLQAKIAISLVFVLFLLSFRKQVGFVVERVEHCKKEIK